MKQGRVAIITGGASGIGLATAKKLLSEGASVVIADLSDKVLDIATSLGEKCLGVKCNVALESDAVACVNKAVEKFGHIDYLVANAGIGGSPAAPDEVSMAEWNSVVAVNQTGIFLMNKYVIKEMLKNGGGSIVNTSSMYGLVGTSTSFSYAATKGAINQMTRCLALSYAKKNIRVNAIAPGYVDTPILAQVPQDMKQAMAMQLPVGRLGQDFEIANLVSYLLSDEASFITGAIVPIDGGYTAQ